MTAEDNALVNRRRNLGYFFAEAVRRVPDKVCIIDLLDGIERTLTYRTLDDRMDRVAGMLARLSIEPGERVGMLVRNRFEFIEFMFGAMRMGAIPVPINTHLQADALGFVLRDAQCVAAVVDPESNPHALDIVRDAPLKHRLLLDGAESGFRPYEDELAVGGSFCLPDIGDDAQA